MQPSHGRGKNFPHAIRIRIKKYKYLVKSVFNVTKLIGYINYALRSTPALIYPPRISFFLYAIHYAWGIGEASVNFFSFFGAYRGRLFGITMYLTRINVVSSTFLPKNSDKNAGVSSPGCVINQIHQYHCFPFACVAGLV